MYMYNMHTVYNISYNMDLYFQSVFGMLPCVFEISEELHMLQAVQSCSQPLHCSVQTFPLVKPTPQETLLPELLHLGSVLQILLLYQPQVFNFFNKKGHLHGEKVQFLNVDFVFLHGYVIADLTYWSSLFSLFIILKRNRQYSYC